MTIRRRRMNARPSFVVVAIFGVWLLGRDSDIERPEAPMADVVSQPAKVGWMQALSGRYLRAPSVLALIAANLLPLYGVLYWGWDLFVLMTVYWLETAIIGFFTAIRLVMVERWGAIILVPFFVVHFGGFMAGHFFFLWVLFAGAYKSQVADLNDFVRVIVFGTGLWFAFLGLFISHGVSFFINVLRPYRERRAAGSKAPAEPENADGIMRRPTAGWSCCMSRSSWVLG
jgi:hypothetical protein